MNFFDIIKEDFFSFLFFKYQYYIKAYCYVLTFIVYLKFFLLLIFCFFNHSSYRRVLLSPTHACHLTRDQMVRRFLFVLFYLDSKFVQLKYNIRFLLPTGRYQFLHIGERYAPTNMRKETGSNRLFERLSRGVNTQSCSLNLYFKCIVLNFFY